MFGKKLNGIEAKSEDEGIIDVEAELVVEERDVVVPGETVYTGEIVTVHDGYSYIGHVKRGYETINTNGDVFVPQEFRVGTLVEFNELNTDIKRPGKYRAESAREINGALVVPGIESERAVALRSMTARSVYHIGAKNVAPEKIEKAAENMPFAEMIGIHLSNAEDRTRDIGELAKEFLQGTFANLSTTGVSYSIEGDVNENEEEKKIEKALKTYRDSKMDGQVESVRDEYRKFKGIRKAFSLMHANNILTMQTVVPIKYLPDLLVAAPVWFVSSRETLEDRMSEPDPRPDHAIEYFCNQVGTEEFAWLFQIYNRRTRPLRKFSGRDIIPLPLMQIMEEARNVFDYTVIATPYHDIASKEWMDPLWLRNIDPFLFGFMKEIPYMFLLGRWSGTGLFPLMLDMIADTIDHLRLNHKKLENFRQNTYWYKGKSGAGNDVCLGGSTGRNESNTVLSPFALEVIGAYEEGRLFAFLRGENATADSVVAV